ncbi:hypothetical protein [Enterococcus sp.]|uniref:hypothetical protein n=1 Tax=Enterococcus sp. TaxID=35783 RepID=UPI0028AC5CCE|nr:hypothetical protein [Enterococcus sp.]
MDLVPLLVWSYGDVMGTLRPQQMPNMLNYILLLNIASTFIRAFAAIYEAVKRTIFTFYVRHE